MEKLTVGLADRAYDICIGLGLLAAAGEAVRGVCPKAKRLFVVTDSNVAPLYLNQVKNSLEGAGFEVTAHVVQAGESAKCAARLAELWEAMMDAGLTRTDAVVALGGGVVGDLAGFAAATVLRGVDFVQIPTTLLAQVDSSVGGKVAIDLEAGKNLAGAFWQPKLVLMDPDTLDSLPLPVFMGGMAEVIKYGCIWDEAFFRFLMERPSREMIMADIEKVLLTCCDIKRQTVEADERDTGTRMLLNFGHTVGHAFELAGHYADWSHGEAVAAGMCAAAKLGVALGVTENSVPEAVAEAVAAFGLPAHIDCGWEAITHAVNLDKKRAGDDITMILLEKIGRAVPVKLKKDALLEQLKAIYGR